MDVMIGKIVSSLKMEWGGNPCFPSSSRTSLTEKWRLSSMYALMLRLANWELLMAEKIRKKEKKSISFLRISKTPPSVNGILLS